jgi:cystathionine gamma-synthase
MMYSFETNAIFGGRPDREPDSPLNTPISLNSTYIAGGEWGYARYGNDSCKSLEETISLLEGGKTLAFSSGMSAINSLFSTLPIGSVVVASNQGYAGVNATMTKLNDEGKIVAKFVDISNTGEVLANLEGAYMLWLESPTNPRLEVADLKRLIRACNKTGVIVGVDNTFATPLNQRPLDMGADMSMNSITKYLAGHSDVLMGSISFNNQSLYEAVEFQRKINGSIAQPFESWLSLRGIRTFPLRFKKAESNAKELFNLISNHKMISKVYYPGFGAMISFEVNASPEEVEYICNRSKLIANATSLGSVESMWERRRRWPLESNLVSESLIRLSVGCESVEDIWRDINNSLDNYETPFK